MWLCWCRVARARGAPAQAHPRLPLHCLHEHVSRGSGFRGCHSPQKCSARKTQHRPFSERVMPRLLRGRMGTWAPAAGSSQASVVLTDRRRFLVVLGLWAGLQPGRLRGTQRRLDSEQRHAPPAGRPRWRWNVSSICCPLASLLVNSETNCGTLCRCENCAARLQGPEHRWCARCWDVRPADLTAQAAGAAQACTLPAAGCVHVNQVPSGSTGFSVCSSCVIGISKQT